MKYRIDDWVIYKPFPDDQSELLASIEKRALILHVFPKDDFYDYGCNGIPNDGDYGEGNGELEEDEALGCFENKKEPLLEDSYNSNAQVLFQ